MRSRRDNHELTSVDVVVSRRTNKSRSMDVAEDAEGALDPRIQVILFFEETSFNSRRFLSIEIIGCVLYETDL